MKTEHALSLVEIRALLNRLAVAGDRGRVEEVADCYVATGILITPQWTAEGRAAIVEKLGETRNVAGTAVGRMRHHLTTCDIVLSGSDNADIRTYFQVWTDHGYDHSGLYIDRAVVNSMNRWLLTRRDVRVEHRSKKSFLPADVVAERR